VRDEPARAGPIVEDAGRLARPSAAVCRRVVADTRPAGITLPAGSRLVVSLLSTNRDERVFPDGNRFDPDRPPRSTSRSVKASTPAGTDGPDHRREPGAWERSFVGAALERGAAKVHAAIRDPASLTPDVSDDLRVTPVRLDLRVPADASAAAGARQHPAIDLLVCNAAIRACSASSIRRPTGSFTTCSTSTSSVPRPDAGLRSGTAAAARQRHGTARHGTARHGTARHGTARHGTARIIVVLSVAAVALSRSSLSSTARRRPPD